MLKPKSLLAITLPLAVTSIFAITIANLANYNGSFLFGLRRTSGDEGGYDLLINSSNRLSGGNVKTPGGTNIHFDEYGVDENPNGGLLELASYGSIALQTYINGIERVEVNSETGENKEFFLTVGASPNSAEYITQGYQGNASINILDGYGSGCFYFSIHNKMENPIIINSIRIHYSCEDTEAGLKALIERHLGSPLEVSYNGNPYNPYDGYEINPSDIPANRKVIPTMSENEYPVAPGHYTYGYDVYDVDDEGNARKLLYTKTKSFTIEGARFNPVPDERKVVTFHIPDENGKEKIICQETMAYSYDLTQIPEECLKYSWESPYNHFEYIGDEHYYPVFRVTGLSANKEGDGCYPVSLTYSYAERGFNMPNPQMKHGYKFGGWYLDFELTKPFDESKLNPGNLVLYAKCIETDLDVRRVYYHYEDGTLADRVDYLYSSDEKLTLPKGSDVLDLPRPITNFFWDVYCGNSQIGLYRQSRDDSQGDKIKYSDFSGYSGDVHIYATDVHYIPTYQWSYDLFSTDADGNNIFQHTQMASSYQRETDFIIPAYAVREREYGEYHVQADGFPIDRTGQFFMTDEKKDAYVIDGGTLKTISSYGYGNIEMAKPLSGILRHEAVKKVSRRAFFGRYGLKGTYFPRNATDFEIEAYANVEFNRVLTLPKNLSKIGDRCFLGANNIKYVCLPRTIKSIGPNAFAYATYNPGLRVFENITNRTVPGNEPITFLYEGSEQDFNILDEVTKDAIRNNASEIVYNYSYGAYYGRG